MKRHLIHLALALSLLFNVFFVVGFMQARAQLARVESTSGVSRLVTDELSLNDAQAAVFSRLRSSLRDEMTIHREALALTQEELVAQLAKAEPDLVRVRELVARKAELHRERRLAGSQRFNEFLGVLSPEQCRAMSRRFHRGPPGRGRTFDALERFDANGDGKLDDEERAAAREFMETRRRERGQRRQEALERFDSDGDGQLDAEERDAFRQWRWQQRGNGPGG